MLSNRYLQVFLNDFKSSWRRLNNGLLQGSDLAPCLFILYISDLPNTVSKKFIYADNLALVYQCEDFEETEKVLEKDLRTMNDYYLDWRLKLNPNKTEVSTFHLNNRMSNKILNITFNDIQIVHNKNPKYLRVWLDRSFKLQVKLQVKEQLIGFGVWI